MPQATIPEPQAATEIEDEDVTDIAVTFADGKDEEPAARIPDDELDEAFSDIRMISRWNTRRVTRKGGYPPKG